METLAYLHLELAYQAPEDAGTVQVLQHLQLCETLNGHKLIGRATIHLLSLSLPLAFVFVVSSARAMKIEEKGSQVSDLQNNLKAAAYYDGAVTGYYGPSTEAAVRRYQEAKGLVADGIAGEATIATLQQDLEGKNTESVVFSVAKRGLQLADRGPEVQEIQQRLKTAGFDPGAIDEKFGAQTEEAVRQFQASRGLYVDGKVGKETWFALRCQGSSIYPYLVTVTPANADTLSQVLAYVPKAYVNDTSSQPNIHAGGFPNYAGAKKHSQMLRSHGLNARVVYIRSSL